jgi:Cu/Ag efflux protein CusF
MRHQALAMEAGRIDLPDGTGGGMMRRIALVSWLMLISVVAGAGVWAATQTEATRSVAVPDCMADTRSLEEAPLAAGKIVAIDRNTGRLTVEHRGIARFYLEPRTAIFHVGDPTLLTGLTPGDKIRFDVERNGKSYVITRIENSN